MVTFELEGLAENLTEEGPEAKARVVAETKAKVASLIPKDIVYNINILFF